MSTERRLLIVLLTAPLLGFIGVMAAHAVPNARIADHLIDAEHAGIITETSDPGPTPLGTTAALYTECTTFSLGLADVPGEGFVADSLLGTAYTGCRRLGAALDHYGDTGELPSGYSYLRYWHGYSILTRPGIGLVGVAGTRWLAFAFMALAVGGTCAAVRRGFGTAPAVLLIAPTLLTTDVVIGSLSASTAIGTGSAWVAGWLSFVLVSDRPAWHRATLVAALAGAITAYLDLMTTMPGSFALTVVGATLGAMAAGVRQSEQGLWRVSAAAAGGWAIGLAGMWASKWLITALTVGLGTVMDSVTDALGFRLSSGTHGVTDSRVRGLTINVEEWWDQPLTAWVVFGSLAVVAVGAIRWRRSKREIGSVLFCCALVAVFVMSWYLALNNHSQIHRQLVYRSLPIAFGAVAALVYAASRGPMSGVTGDVETSTDVFVADGHIPDGDEAGDADLPEPEGERIPWHGGRSDGLGPVPGRAEEPVLLAPALNWIFLSGWGDSNLLGSSGLVMTRPRTSC